MTYYDRHTRLSNELSAARASRSKLVRSNIPDLEDELMELERARASQTKKASQP